MSKNPYEVRLDLIRISQEHINQKYYAEREARMDRKIDYSDLPFPTFENILEEATKLKSFVDGG